MKLKNNLYSPGLAIIVVFLFLFILVPIVAVAPADDSGNSYAYITNTGSNTVSVINNSNTSEMVHTIFVGDYPNGVAVSPDGTKVYVTNFKSNDVSVIDTIKNTVSDPIKVGMGPVGVAVSPDGTKVYVTNFYSDNVSVIDTSTKKVTNTKRIGSGLEGVAIYGSRVYVASNDNLVYLIDTASDVEVTSVPVGKGAYGVAISPEGIVYVTNIADNTVSIIKNDKFLLSWPVGTEPYGVAFDSKGKHAYVACDEGNLFVINESYNDKFYIGKHLRGVSLTPDGTKVYVADTNGIVYIFDTATNTVVGKVPVGSGPCAFGQFIGTPPKPEANFSSSVIGGYAPLSVQFNDTSLYAKEINWNFGDSSDIVSVANPEHVYKSTGSFPVVLTASNVNGLNSKSITINVTPKPIAPPVLPTAVFEANNTTGTAPLTVQFNDLSTNETTGRTWTFSDGGSSTDPKPVHIYNYVGTFTVNLTASNENGSSPPKTVTITVLQPGYPVANFNSNITSGKAPLDVQFNDTSLNATGWSWDFGDGNNSMLQSPMHTYVSAGTYSIKLTASNANGTSSKTSTITVLQPVLPVANFSFDPKSGNAPLKVQFNDSSLNATGWSWDFGDGNNSTEQNPIHTFSAAGNYTVNLTVSNANGTNSTKATINVKKSNPYPILALLVVLIGVVILKLRKKKVPPQVNVMPAKEEIKRYCMHCGEKMTKEASNCPICGRIPPSGIDTKPCSTCQAVLPQSAKFCDSCGARQPEVNPR